MRTVDIGDFTVGDGHRPRVMGVLNMSIESNWEPNVETTPEEAARFAEQELIDAGADIVDIGLQSANPKNDWLPAAVELDRLPAALEVIDRVDSEAVFSIETRYAEVAQAALEGGFDLVNDVCGFADERMPDVCESHDAPVVKMASPPDLKKPGHIKTIDDVFTALQRGGFTDKTIIDPAFGGWYDEKTFEDNWEMFRRLREFRAFGRPLLTGTNREDFLGFIADKMENEDQLSVSLAAATLEVDRGVDIIRTHDIPETADVVKVAHHLQSERLVTESPRIVELREISRGELQRFETLTDTEPGVLSNAALYCFQIERIESELQSQLQTGAAESGATLLQNDTGLVLVGSREQLRELIVRTDGSGAVAELIGNIRETLTR